MEQAQAIRDRIQLAIVQFNARVILYNHVVAQREGLGASDAQFLTLLQVHGALTAGQLAQQAGLSTGTTTGVIDRLERAGFVHRVADPLDRRKVIVQRDEAAIGESFPRRYAQHSRQLAEVLATRSVAELGVIDQFLTDLLAQPDP